MKTHPAVPALTPQEARDAGYSGWCQHLHPYPCIRESRTVYCATCDPWKHFMEQRFADLAAEERA